MSLLVTPPMLQHVQSPLAPVDPYGSNRESMVGFLTRTSRENFLTNTKVLIQDGGLPIHQKACHLATTRHDVSGLAIRLKVDLDWVLSARHPPMGASTSRAMVNSFHSAHLRREHLFYEHRSFAPEALRSSPHHRDMWHISTLPCDTHTWEMLDHICPNAGCHHKLGWTKTKGIAVCEACRGALDSGTSSKVPAELHDGLTLAASLVTPDAALRRATLETLHESLRAENGGTLFELAWQLGVASHANCDHACTSPRMLTPGERLQVLSRGADLLRNWPASAERMLAQAGREGGKDAMTLVVGLRAVLSKKKVIGRAVELLEPHVAAVRNNSFSTLLAGSTGHLTARQLEKASGVSRRDIKRLRDADLLDDISLHENVDREFALYSTQIAAKLSDARVSRMTPRELAGTIGISVDGAMGLLSRGIVAQDANPLLTQLSSTILVDRSSAEGLVRRLEGRLESEVGIDAIPLRIALRLIRRPDKPWGELVQRVLEGDLRLIRNTGPLALRECLVPEALLAQVAELNAVEDETPQDWLATHVSDPDAWERMNCGMQHLRVMTKAGTFASTGRLDGLTFPRESIDAIAREKICSTEIRMRRPDLRHVFTRFIDKAIGQTGDAASFYPRDVAERALGIA